MSRRTLAIVGAAAVLAGAFVGSGPAGGRSAAPSGRRSAADELVVTLPTDRGGPAEVAACRRPDLDPSGCTLRGALAVAAERAGTTTIRLPAAAIWLSSGLGLPVSGSVRIVGAGARSSSLVVTERRAFRLEPGARLALEHLAVVGGDASAPTSVGPARATLHDVLVADRVGADLGGVDLALTCGPPGSQGRFLTVRSAVLAQPLAAGALPGAVA